MDQKLIIVKLTSIPSKTDREVCVAHVIHERS